MSRRQNRTVRDAAAFACESLEPRRLLCNVHVGPIHELAPETIDPETGISPPNPSEVLDPANIVWTNRGQASDNFTARFGTSAGTARAVVDAVIDYFELMIGSFDYTLANQTFNLTLSMGASGGGFGASAGLNSSLGGKPKSGSVTMGAGNGSADPNDDNGWFLDPTPYDNSEFMGNIVNAFAGDAQTGSPAAGKGDFFTVVAAELTHCLGLFGNALAGWHNRTTNTGIPDTAEGGGVGTFWVFNGNTIDHLLTSNNGGGGGGNWGSAIHAAGPGVNVNFGGNTYVGAQDIGNAVYEFGRRYMVNNTFAMMFKDAYGFATVNPSRFGTFYSSPFSSTGVVTVRGGAGTSADNIQIFRSAGNTLTVAVDVGNDVPGTGSLPGAGNQPAFVSVYDINQVSSIVVDSGSGDDVIFLDTTNFSASLSEAITINAGAGNDSLTTTFFGGNLDFLTGPITFNGGTGTDSITMYDNAATFSDTYTITQTTISRTVFGGLTYSGAESLHLNAESGNNTFNISGTPAGMSMTLEGRNGNDTFNIGLVGGNAEGIDGALTVHGQNGTDTFNYNDTTSVGDPTYTVQPTQVLRSFNAVVAHSTMESLRLEAGSGNNSIIVEDDPNALPLTVNGNGGDDSIQVGINVLRFSAVPDLAVNGGTGTDQVTLSTTLTGSGTFGAPTLSSTSYSCPTARTVNYSAFEDLVFNVQYVESRVIFILSTAATTPVTINGGVMSDIFEVGGRPGFFSTVVLDNILGPLTLNGNGGADTVNLNDHTTTAPKTYTLNGSTFTRNGAAPVSFATSEAVVINAGDGADTINIVEQPAGVPVTVDGRAGLDDVNVNSDGVGSAAVNFAATQDLASLNILAGGTAILTAGGNKVIETDALAIAATGKLDLTDNDMIVDYTTTSPHPAIQARLTSGYNGGAWNGNGIYSSTAAGTSGRGIGYAEAFEIFNTFPATFSGRPVDDTAVLMKFTFTGDANLSGSVTLADFNRLADNFGLAPRRWIHGNSDYDNDVDLVDFNALASNFGGSGLRAPGAAPGGGAGAGGAGSDDDEGADVGLA